MALKNRFLECLPIRAIHCFFSQPLPHHVSSSIETRSPCILARKLTASSPIYSYLNECLTYVIGTSCMHSLTHTPSFYTLDCKLVLKLFL